MGSLSGILQRPILAATAVAVVSASADISDKFQSFKSSETGSTLEQNDPSISNSVLKTSSWASHISVSKLSNLSFVTRISVPVPNISFRAPNLGQNSSTPNVLCSSVASSPLLVNLYQSAELGKALKPSSVKSSISTSAPDVLYRWHLPEPNAIDVSGVASDCSSMKSRTVVVLLGWLGAKQKHLKKYAEWYTSMGFHVITFTFPMAEVLSYQVGGKAEQNVELLVNHLADWLEEEHGKSLVFHTFSNTGWLTYGVILEKFQKQDPLLMGRIRGCIIDSAPVAAPDPQVWASGFSAAFLKRRSVATKRFTNSDKTDANIIVGHEAVRDARPAVTETALLVVLEKVFDVVLHLPTVNR